MTTYNKYDLNKDGRVNQSDLDYLRRAISKEAGEDSMDLNGDGAIDDKDIQALKQYLVTTPPDPFPDDEYTRWIIKSYLNPKYKIKPKIFWRGYEPVYHDDINTLGKAVLEMQEKLKTYEPPDIQLPEELPEDFDLSKFADENYLVDITAENKDIWTFSTSVASETFNTTRGLITDVEQVPYGIRFSTSYGMSYFVPYFLIDVYLSPSDIKLHSLLRGALGKSEGLTDVLSDKVKTVSYDFVNQPVQFYPFVHFPHYGRTLAITKGVEGAEKSFVQALTVDEISGEYFEDPSAVMSLKSLGKLSVIIPLAEGVIIRSVTEDRFYLLVPEIVSKNGGNTLKKYIANEVEGVGTLLRLTDIWTAQFASLVDERALTYYLNGLDKVNLPINEMTSVNSFHFLLPQERTFGTVIFEPTCIDGTTIYLPSKGVETSYVANLENSSMRNHYNVVAQTSGTSTPRVTFLSDISASDTSASVLATIPPNWTKGTHIAIDSSGVSFTKVQKANDEYEHPTYYRNYLGLKDMSAKFKIFMHTTDEQVYPTMKWGQMYYLFKYSASGSFWNETVLIGVNFWGSDGQPIKDLTVTNFEDNIRKNLTFTVPDITNAGLQLPIAIKSTGTNEYQYAFLPLK